MRLTTVQVGPLAASSATKISVSQKPSGAFAVVLDGAASTGYSATNIANTQAPGAAALTLNGSLAQGSPATAWLGGQSVVIVSSGNDSGITFKVVGTDARYAYLSETVTGANASRVATRNLFYSITSITPSAGAAANVSAGTNGLITLDTARQVLFTNGGNDSAITATVYGTDWNGELINEVVTQSNASTATTKYDFATISAIWMSAAAASTLTVGTNGVARSRPIFMDRYALAPTSLQVTVSGTTNWTVQQSNDDASTLSGGYTSATWINSPDSTFVAATGSLQSNYAYLPTMTRVVLNSQTNPGFIVYTVLQASGTVL